MMSNIHVEMKKEYDRRLIIAHDELERRKSEAYAKAPRLEEIENEIRLTGVRHNKLILSGTQSPDELLPALEARLDRLSREKENILKELGFPEDFLSLRYQCPACKDSGIIQTAGLPRQCSCSRQMYLNYLYRQSNLKISATQSFEAFDESYYSTLADVQRYGIPKSPKAQITHIKNCCLDFIERFREPFQKSLFFCGPTGVGKTFMAGCIAIELMSRGVTVLYESAPRLFNAINEYRVRMYRDDIANENIYKSLMEVELLIIDDLGSEPKSAAKYADLLTILNTRHSNNIKTPCKTIISSNIEIEHLDEYYDERIVSRITGDFSIFKFAGDDIRSLKAFGKKKV